MPYSNNEFKESNINYINKDFINIKNSLINYAKGYFPDTYKDFNETSPGMMLMEMNAYVGDVLSFYIDQQYREMMLPLAEEKRNVLNIAKMLGYKVKPTSPSYVDLTFKQVVSSVGGDEAKVDYSTAGIFESGIEVSSTTNSDIVFQTLGEVDFTISASGDNNVIRSTNTSTGLIESYELTRNVKAISSETKTQVFSINKPSKFMKLTLPETNVIEIISCIDSNNNRWYEVEYLAQDKVPVETPYWEDLNRYKDTTGDGTLTAEDTADAYVAVDGSIMPAAVPYSLEYIQTNKRFMVDVSNDNKTSLVFGNGILRNGVPLSDEILDMEQLGIIIPGQTSGLTEEINPLLGDDFETLGETPNNITLTITYRVGGGLSSNVAAGELITFTSPSPLVGSGELLSVINREPSVGGKPVETVEEIRHNSSAFFATQNRCVTKEDYEARVLNLPSKFGGIAKVYVSRALDVSPVSPYSQIANQIDLNNTIAQGAMTSLQNLVLDENFSMDNFTNDIDTLSQAVGAISSNALSLMDSLETTPAGSIYIHILAYDKFKNLLGNPAAPNLTGVNDGVPKVLMQNINNYLQNYKLLTDDVEIKDGYVINFGVNFDVVSHRFSDKKQVKLNCIEKIRRYFSIDKMNFGQAIHISQLEYELMNVDGVRSINEIKIVQEINGVNLYRYSIDDGGVIDESGGNGTVGYGYKYDFSHSYSETTGGTKGVVLPPHPNNPGVFELKNPNRNIIGVVN
tara:strand:- start:349 stop:2568 length:2220 start_codon:yes stop_codon:yes gene_type:complete